MGKSKETYRKDINGVLLVDGDIVAQCKEGDVLWDGMGIVRRCPLGLVRVFDYNIKQAEKPDYPPGENDYYNVVEIREGVVELTDKAPDYMRRRIYEGKDACDLHISRYDGQFYGWHNIEKIGNVWDDYNR